MTTFRSAQQAARDVGVFFLHEHWTDPQHLDLRQLRELADRLTVINYYLEKKQTELLNKFLAPEHEYQHQIRDGNLGSHVSRDGRGVDYHVPAGQADGKLVEVVVRGQSCASPDSMLLGE